MSRFRVPSVPKVPRVPAVPGMGALPPLWEAKRPQAGAVERDEFGLSVDIYGKAPSLSRQYIAQCLDYLNKPKTVNPSQIFGVSAGTIPELAVFGFLLASGFVYRTSGARSFTWLSYELGAGEVAPTTQLDFSVYLAENRRIGVDVDSIFHTEKNPFAAGAKLEHDRRRRLRLLALPTLANVISVNEGHTGHCLEFGPNQLVAANLQRILVA